MNPVKFVAKEVTLYDRKPDLGDYLVASLLIIAASSLLSVAIIAITMFTITAYPWSLILLGFVALVFGAGIKAYLEDRYDTNQ